MALASDADAIYMNTTNTDMTIHAGDKLDMPTFILVQTLLHKDIEIYIWMDNIKNTNNLPSQHKYFSNKNSWELLTFNQFQPVVKFNSFSPYYNYVLSYGTISGIKSFMLNVCVKESSHSFFSIPANATAIKKSSICGSQPVVIGQIK